MKNKQSINARNGQLQMMYKWRESQKTGKNKWNINAGNGQL